MVFPAPVAPATSKWGMRDRSANQGLPETSFPRDKSKEAGEVLYWSASKSARSRTCERTLFGTSMPTKALPGMGASIRIGWAAKAKARSFESPVMRDSFTPSAGRMAY